MAKKAVLFFALGLFVLSVMAQDEGGGLIEGDSWAFLVSAPDGWAWDRVSLRRQGIQGLFCKEGSKFAPFGLHMYIDPKDKEPAGPASLSDLIELDESALLGVSPDIQVQDLAPYSPGMDYSFILRDLDDPQENDYKAFAYYEGEGAYFVFVLSCRSGEERELERASFLELLGSFVYIQKE